MKLTIITSTLVIALLSACSGEGVKTPGSGGQSADFNDEVFSHQSWDMLSPLLQKSDMPTGKMEMAVSEIVEDDEYACDITEYSLTDSPAEFIGIQPDSSIVWLGNLIQGDSHLNVGSLEELSIDSRSPINISLNILTNDNARTVENPSLANVNSAIGSLIAGAIAEGVEGPTDSYYEEKEAHSTNQSSLELGFSAEYLGASAQARLQVDKMGSDKSFFAYFIQKAYTFSMELPTSPQDMVSNQFSEAALEDLRARGQIGENNPPLYISSVTYGKVLIYKMTASYTSNRMAAAIKASYEGVTGGASGFTQAELEETLATAEIEIATFGGNQESAEGLIRTGMLADYFTADTRLDEFRPISFELRNLKDNTKAGISRTTKYDVKVCTYVGKTTEPVGEQTKITLRSVQIPADCDAGVDKGDIFGYFNVIAHNPATGADYSRPIYSVAKGNSVPVQSGDALSINKSYTINQYYGTTFQLSGRLQDADGGANGADDDIGFWNGNQNSISGRAPGSYTNTATRNCSGQQPRLTYTLERLQYLY